MKTSMLRKAKIFLIAIGTLLMTVQIAMALPYFEVGLPSNSGTPTSLIETYYGGSPAIYFTNQPITAPSGDSLVGRYQSIGGLYTLTSVGGNVYNLTYQAGASGDYGTNIVKAQNLSGSATYFTAEATALQINFNTHSISWSDVTNVSFNNTITSTSLTDLSLSSTYAFTTFTFEALGTESTWLSGTTGTTYNARYYSRLDGFSAVPEPAEWMLMMIGLALMGYYLHRKGFLNLQMSPQTYA